MNPIALSGVISNILELNGSNYPDWHEQVLIFLGCLDLDLYLHINEPAQPTPESSQGEKALYENWERSNRLSLMVIKSKIAKHIRKSILDSTRVHEFFTSVGK